MINMNKKLFLIAPYGISVSTLYLLGYWGTFEINIFEYADISDILKISVYQLVILGFSLSLSIIIAELFRASSETHFLI